MGFIFETWLMVKSRARVFPHRMCLWLAISCISISAHGFALLGPYESWMQQENGFRLPLDVFAELSSDTLPVPGRIGEPMYSGQGYRWNVPTVTYGFDSSFVAYFGLKGVTAVQEAIRILNDLPAASEIDLAKYPDFTTATNSEAQAENLLDLRSAALSLLLEQLGLASPTESIFELHSWRALPGNPSQFAYQTVARNFDPTDYAPSAYVNGFQYDYQILNFQPTGLNLQLAAPYLMGEPDSRNLFYSAVADKKPGFGGLFSGFTADDAGGLRYLYSGKNVNYETLLPGVEGAGSNRNSFVNAALRPGVGKIKFVAQPYDAKSVQFLALTNEYIDTYFTNGVFRHQQLRRVVTQPDFLFSAGDTEPDYPVVVPYARSGTSNWINSAANGSPSAPGPGIIAPPVRITFTALGKQTRLQGTNLFQQVNDQSYYWASFDKSSNAPIVYPQA